MKKRWGLLSVIIFVAVVALAAWLDTTPPGADENQRGWQAQQKKDYATALEWYDKAAALGDARAENNLGWLYEHGQGVKQDYAQALAWYGKAAARGDVGAEINLAWLYAMARVCSRIMAKRWLGTARRRSRETRSPRPMSACFIWMVKGSSKITRKP